MYTAHLNLHHLINLNLPINLQQLNNNDAEDCVWATLELCDNGKLLLEVYRSMNSERDNNRTMTELILSAVGRHRYDTCSTYGRFQLWQNQMGGPYLVTAAAGFNTNFLRYNTRINKIYTWCKMLRKVL